MPLTKSGTISKSVRVGKFVGVGFLNVPTSRGDVKMYSGDHIVEVDYNRAPRREEKGFGVSNALVARTTTFVVPEDAARALNIYLKESVEEENERLAKEAEAKRIAEANAPPKA